MATTNQKRSKGDRSRRSTSMAAIHRVQIEINRVGRGGW